MRVQIDDTDVQTKSGTSAKGKPYEIHTQTAYLDLGKRYPAECKIRIADKSKPFPPGEYVIDFAKSVFVDKFNRIALGEEIALEPFGAPADATPPKPAK